MVDTKALHHIATQLRIDVVKAVYTAQSGHIGGSLSAADIVASLYFHRMRVDPANPDWEDRDRFIMSKGHAAPVLYAALARKGFFDISQLCRLRQADSFLQGASSFLTPGIDMSSGPLGQGLCAGIGMACAAKYLKKDFMTYIMIGDGEMQEGQIWEGMLAAPAFRLDNLVCILDNNGIQMNGRNDEIMPIGDPAQKARVFGWTVREIDGHDMQQLVDVLDWKNDSGKPLFIVAHTIKSKGVSFMQDDYRWHGRAPSEEQYKSALKELEGVMNE
jgi:transketolase